MLTMLVIPPDADLASEFHADHALDERQMKGISANQILTALTPDAAELNGC